MLKIVLIMSLCAIHDKAFDRGILTVDEEYKVLLSSDIRHVDRYDAIRAYFTYYEHKEIHMPEKFAPKQEFLDYHRHYIFAE